MPKKVIDIMGIKYGRLTVIKRVENKNNKIMWLCKCDCGNEKVVAGICLKNGKTKSCGCYRKELINQYNTKQRKYNKYQIMDYYVIGYTSKNEIFYFDLEDMDLVISQNRCWHKNNYGYIIIVKKQKEIKLHNLIMNPPKGKMVDHINGCIYDNRKINLRICLEEENAKNKKTQINNTSGVKGVTWNKRVGKWYARININKKRKVIGSFINFEEAVRARKEAEIKYYKEFRSDR